MFRLAHAIPLKSSKPALAIPLDFLKVLFISPGRLCNLKDFSCLFGIKFTGENSTCDVMTIYSWPVIFDATPDTAYVNHFSRENLFLVLRFRPHLAKDLLEINILCMF